MTDKHTGLGDSLLLQRTAPPQRPELPTVPQPMDRLEHLEANPEHVDQPAQSNMLPQNNRSPQSDQPPRPLRDRCTIYLDREVNAELDFVARIERRERSAVVSEILRGHLPKYHVNQEHVNREHADRE
jgi:hypothetical protein